MLTIANREDRATSQPAALPSASTPERMKIALAAWAPFWAGAEVAAMRLGLGLRDAGHEVLMIVGTNGDAQQKIRDSGLRCELVPMQTSNKWTFWRDLAMQRRLRGLLHRERPDVIHANDLPTGQMIGRAAKLANVPRVCHHRWVFEGPAIDWLNKHGAERHVFVSNYLMNELGAASPTLAASPGAVVYDGLPLGEPPTKADQTESRRRLGLPTDKKIVLLAGQVIERKGIADALDAWRQLAGRSTAAAELHLVGDDLENHGAYRREMEQLAHRLGVAARFHGFRQDIPDWLAACDIVLVPSHIEPLGNATLEAMAAGRPVIGARTGGIPEMIIDGKTGLLVAPKNSTELAAAIEQLLADPTRCQTLGDAARRQCEERFSLQQHALGMVNEYQKAIQEAPLS